MLLVCILCVGVLHVASRERRSLGRGSGLLLTRTIRARSHRLQEMMNLAVHNLKWILQKQRQKDEQKKMHTKHDVVHHHSIRLSQRLGYPNMSEQVKGLLASLDLLSSSLSFFLCCVFFIIPLQPFGRFLRNRGLKTNYSPSGGTAPRESTSNHMQIE